MKKFNDALFSALVNANNHRNYSSPDNGLENVLQVLCQASDESRSARLNHNCKIIGLPFCWHYWRGYGDDATEVKVLSFPMTKVSTGWHFILDVEENGSIYLSEGRGTRRTSLKLSDLNAFSPSTRESMFAAISYVCNSSSTEVRSEELFYFYKQADAIEETMFNVFDDTDRPYLYKAQQIKDIPETRHLRDDKPFDNPHPYDDARSEELKKHLFIGRWCEEHQRWYVDVVFENSAWGFESLRDPGSYPFIEFNSIKSNIPPLPEKYRTNIQPSFDTMLVPDVFDDEKSSNGVYVVDGDCHFLKINNDLQSEMLSFVAAMWKNGDGEKGTWLGYVDNSEGFLTIKTCRKWSDLPSESKIHIYVAPTEVAKYYDDIDELDFSPEEVNSDGDIDMARALNGDCRFKHDHSDDLLPTED